MSEKKRKRESNNVEKPKKKVVINAPPTKINVSVLRNDTQLCPVVASASGLSLPQNIALKAWKRPHDKSKSYDLHLHSNTHPRLDYSVDIQQDGLATNHLKHYIGVYDESSGTLRVMEAQKLEVRSVLRPSDEDIEKEKQAQTIAARRIALGLEFGTKKSKKAIAAVTENAITRNTVAGTTAEELKANPLAAAVLDSIASATTDMPTRADVQIAVDASKPRPIPNLSATTPSEVYTTESVIGERTFEDIPVKDWQKIVEDDGDIQTGSRFVAKRLLPALKKGDVKRVKILRYLLALVDFYAALKSGKSKTGKVLPPKELLVKRMQSSPSLIDGIKRKFAKGVEMNRWQIDYLMTHIAALTLIIDNYETDMFDLKEDLRLDLKQMSQYYSELGCRITPLSEKEREARSITKAAAVAHKVAKLRLPLEFPKVRNPITAKRR